MNQLFPFIVNHWLLCLGLVVVLVLIFLVEQGVQLGGVAAISPQAAINLINHENAVVIDTRNAEAYRNGHIIDSKNISAAEIETKKQRMDKYKNKPLIIVCANGQESAKIAANLKKQAFNQVVYIKGGIAAWTMVELPLAKK